MIPSDFVRCNLIMFSNFTRCVNSTIDNKLLILICISITHRFTGINLVYIVYQRMYC